MSHRTAPATDPQGRDSTLRILRRSDALFLGPLPPPERHAHHAIQASFALEGALRVSTDHGRTSLPSVLIAADVTHEIAAPGRVGHFYVAPESRLGAKLCAWLGTLPSRPLTERLTHFAVESLRRAWRAPEDLETCLDGLLRAIAAETPGPVPAPDPRVVAAQRVLREDADPTLAELAERVGLSPERLRHLFVRDTGISIRGYRRWLRLLRSLPALADAGSVTEAAIGARFADGAHLSRVFRDAFCEPPREFQRGSRFVQARPGERD